MKTVSKRFAVLLMVAVLLAMSAVPALAVNSYTPKAGGTVTLPETLYLQKADTLVPTVTYALSIDNASTPYKGTTGTTAWTAASFTGAPTVTTGTVAFTPASTVLTDGSGDWSRYVTGNFVLDFSTVSFKEPGVYRYDLTKTKTGTDVSDVSNNRAAGYITCYVADDGLGTMTLTDVVYTNSTSAETAGGRTLGKNYLDQYPSINNNLTISKTVAGTQGSKTQYFQFTIALTGGVPNAQYEVTGTYDATTGVTEYNAAAIDNHGATQLNTTTVDSKQYITLNASGAYSGTIWMQHGQSVTINGLPKNIVYTVDEVAATADGYSESHTGDETGTIGDSAVVVAYTNTKEGSAPTGILMQYGAPMAGIILAASVFTVLVATKRKKVRYTAR